MTRKVPARGLSIAAASLITALLLGTLYFLLPGGRVGGGRAAGPMRTNVHDIGNESFYESAPEVQEEVTNEEVVAREIVLQDAPVGDRAEAVADMPFQEAEGESAGVTEGTIEGPQSNSLLGTGGGAGGAFAGRGGMRSRTSGGGGSAAHGGQATSSVAPPPEEVLARRSSLVAHTARLRVGEDEYLALESQHVNVRVDGFRARVTLDWVFVNDRDRTLEGTFQVRLPDGAVPAVLGFGQALPQAAKPAAANLALAARAPTSGRGDEGLRFARFAPRARAADAYRETARARPVPRDPALLEWAASGVFDTRVYPLTAKTRQRVVFAYDVALEPQGDDLVLHLEFPKAGPEPVVTVAARTARVTPKPDAEGRVRFASDAERRLEVRTPLAEAPVLEGEDGATGPLFAAVVRPEVPAAPARTAARAVFLLDVSGSARGPRFAAHLDLLTAILERNRAQLREFRVAFFHVETAWWRPDFVPNTPENVEALRAEAKAVVVGGGTDLGAALDAAARVDGDCDVFLLGDGVATWGERDSDELVRRVPAGRPLFAYAFGGAGSDRPLVERLARKAGGGVFAVGGPDGLGAAATAHAVRPWRLVGAEIEGVEEVLLAGRPETLYPGAAFTVVGRGRPAPRAPLVLHLERDGVRERREIPLGPRLASDLALGAYGRVAVEHLEEGGATLGDLARAYALHLGIVSASVSLVMLDTDDAYARFGIDAKADALAVQSSEPGRLAARARATASVSDPRAAYARWMGEGRRRAGAPEHGAFERVLALIPPDALRPRRPAVRTGAEAQALDGRLRALLTTDDAGMERLLEAAQTLSGAGDAAGALRTLSAIVEANPGEDAVLRTVAFHALVWGYPHQAAELLARVAERAAQPQVAFATLGAAWAEAGQPGLALLAYEAALARPPAGGRADADAIALADYGQVLRQVRSGSGPMALRLFAVERLRALGLEPAPRAVDLMVTIQWNTDATDVDLHVTNPSGEDCYYGFQRTRAGGRISTDVTDGHGPERFVQERAPAGTYGVSVWYFRSDERRTSLRSYVLATVHEDWGRPTQTMRRRVLALESTSQRLEVTRVKRAEPAAAR